AQVDPSLDAADGLNELYELNFAYGACLLIPTTIFRRIGLFDERFFLQLEETDFFLRARRVGFRSFCLPRARILHKVSRSFGGEQTPIKTYYIVRNTFLLMEKHHCTPGILSNIKYLYWSLERIAMVRIQRRVHMRRRSGSLFWPRLRFVSW